QKYDMLYWCKGIRRLNFSADMVVKIPAHVLRPAHIAAQRSVMKRCLCIALLFYSVVTTGQALRDINYSYLYTPNAEVRLELKPVRDESSFTILYDLHVKDTSGLMNQFSLEWEGRDQLSDKTGRALTLNDLVFSRHASGVQGRGTIPIA